MSQRYVFRVQGLRPLVRFFVSQFGDKNTTSPLRFS
jgi:hypothetical protein